MSLLQRHHAVPDSVLDLASGSGAFLARLRDAGARELHAIELDAGHFGLAGVEPRPLDLNGSFGEQYTRRFSLVTAIEIIEHLDNPRHFLRQIHGLLNEQGHVLLSTPNVGDWVGRVKFLLGGELRYFDEANYRRQRHITPIPDLQMRLMLPEVGFELVESIRAGSFFGPLKKLATVPIWLPMRLVCGKSVLGDVSIYLARRVTPDQASPGTSPLYFQGRT